MTYTGDTLIEGGTLQLQGGSERIADVSDVVISSGAVLDLNDLNETVGSISGAGDIDLGSGDLTFGSSNTDTLLSGDISGTGDLGKNGTGVMTFSGSSSATGGLTINAGTVAIGADNTFSAAMDLILNGGTLQTSGFDQTFNSFTQTASSFVDFNETAGANLSFGSATVSAGTLGIANWVGAFGGGGDTQFLVTSASAPDVSNMTFVGIGDAVVIGSSGDYEIVPDTSAYIEWTGGADPDDSWNTNGNWDANHPDARGSRALIQDADANLDGKTILLDNDNEQIGTLVISNTTGADFEIGGSKLLVIRNTAGVGTGYITAYGNSTPEISARVRMRDDLLITNNLSDPAGLHFSNGQFRMSDDTTERTLTVTGSGYTKIDSSLRGDDGSTTVGLGYLIKNGEGILELNGVNYLNTSVVSPAVELNGGTLRFGNNAAAGAAVIALNGGTVEATGGDRVLTNAIEINNDFSVGNDDGSDLEISGTGTIADGAHTIDVASGIIFDLSGVLSEANLGLASLRKTGAGELILDGATNDFTGLVVDVGTVSVDTASELTIGGSGTGNFLGDGSVTVNGGILDLTTSSVVGITIPTTGTVTNTGGTINVDASAGTGSDFNLNGQYSHSGGTTTVTVDDDIVLGGAADLLVSGGTVNLNAGDDFSTGNSSASIALSNDGDLNVDLSGGVAASNFDLAENDTISVEGSGSTLTITPDADGTVTVDGEITLADSGTMVVADGATTFSAVSRLDGGTEATKGTLEVRGDLTMAGDTEVINAPNLTFAIADGVSAIDATFNGSAAATNIENLGTVTKTGDGTLALGANLNNVQAGEIDLQGGTLLLSTSDQIANNTDMTLSGGTWDTDGNDEVLGSLTLSADSNILLGDGDSVVQFADSSGEIWSDDTVVINEWTGNVNGGGTDQISFGTDAGGLTSAQLDNVFFVNPNGLMGTYKARILPSGEVVPVVPEPKAYVVGVALFVLIGVHYYRRSKQRKRVVDMMDGSTDSAEIRDLRSL